MQPQLCWLRRGNHRAPYSLNSVGDGGDVPSWRSASGSLGHTRTRGPHLGRYRAPHEHPGAGTKRTQGPPCLAVTSHLTGRLCHNTCTHALPSQPLIQWVWGWHFESGAKVCQIKEGLAPFQTAWVGEPRQSILKMTSTPDQGLTRCLSVG